MRALLTAGIILVLTSWCAAGVVHVPGDQPTIQEGIDAAVSGDSVLVDPGVYTGIGNQKIEFLYKSLTLASVAGPDMTIIDCQADTANLGDKYGFRIIYNINPVVIEGFTVRNCSGDTAGGAYIVGSSVVFRHCDFMHNRGKYGGAYYVSDSPSDVAFIDCQFIGNSTPDISAAGTIRMQATAHFENCLFSENTARNGSFLCYNASPTVNNCRFINNTTTGTGGAVFLQDNCSPIFTNCWFENNLSQYGGALWVEERGFIPGRCDPIFTGCTFVRNSAQKGGAVYYNGAPAGEMINCTFYDNNAPFGSFAVTAPRLDLDSFPDVAVENCIIAYGTGDVPAQITAGEMHFSCTDIYGNLAGDWVGDIADQATGSGNFSQDPMFCDTAAEDFGLWYTSPCRPQMNSCATLIGASDEMCGYNPIVLTIEKAHNVLQGHFQEISVVYSGSTISMGGFDFLIAYDASALAFSEAAPGQLLEDCGWEYFTYRCGVDGNCGDGCPSGLLRLIAMAETANGTSHPSCFGPPDTGSYVLATMTFYVSNDRTFACQYTPVRFFWRDCNDNSVSSVSGDTLYVSDRVYDLEGTDITDSTYGFPTYFGIQQGCLEGGGPGKPAPVPSIFLIDGGIDIVCADSIDLRGDINANGVPDEVADAVMFTNFFISGLPAFGDHVEASIAASDVNADGITLTVADLVYLIRVMIGDASPYPKPGPAVPDVSVRMSTDRDMAVIAVNSPEDIGAGYFEIDHSGGDVGEPRLLDGAEHMSLKYSDRDGVLRILVYSLKKDVKIDAGNTALVAVPLTGEESVVFGDVQLADYFGNVLQARIDKASAIPKTFGLEQNFPNPFNASTAVVYDLAAQTDVRIDIFNIIGQRIATIVDGEQPAGVHRVIWNGTDESGDVVASGIYFYRIATPEFTAEKKMILMK